MDELPREYYQLGTYVKRMQGEAVLPGHEELTPESNKWQQEIGNILNAAGMYSDEPEFEGTPEEWHSLDTAMKEKMVKYNLPENQLWQRVMEKIRLRCDTRRRE